VTLDSGHTATLELGPLDVISYHGYRGFSSFQEHNVTGQTHSPYRQHATHLQNYI